MEIISIKTDVFTGGENIFDCILKAKVSLSEGDIISLTSKVVALSQNRLIKISDYGQDKEEVIELLVKQESEKVYPGDYTLTMKDGILIPRAWIDESNVPEGYLLLWPQNSYEFAKDLQQKLTQHFKIKNCGVLVTDSRCQPLRMGVTGLAVAWYGFAGVEDVRGQKDLFQKKLQVTRKAVADNLASSAILVQGEGGECTPLAIIKKAPVNFKIKDDYLKNAFINPDEDIFQAVFNF